jgi:hypothetical protein
MAASAVALDLSKTEQCKAVSIHFHMGIGRMRQIAAKVLAPEKASDAFDVNALSSQAVVVTTAKASELRHQKRLINSPELDAIRSQDCKLKSFIESRSAAAGMESTRFVLNTEIRKIWRAMEAYANIRRPELVAAFMAKYKALEAVDFEPLREVLGDQFERGDYPPSAVVEAGFYFHYTIRDVGTIQLTGLPDYIIEQEREKERKQRAEAIEEFKADLRLAGAKLVDVLYDTVKPQSDGKKRKFYDSSVENLVEFIQNYNKQDMANDLGMQTEVENLKKILNGVTPDHLKENDGLKKHIYEQLAEVKKNIGALVVETGRKFR